MAFLAPGLQQLTGDLLAFAPFLENFTHYWLNAKKSFWYTIEAAYAVYLKWHILLILPFGWPETEWLHNVFM